MVCIVGGTGRILDGEGGFNRKLLDFNKQNKSKWSVHHSVFVGLEQDSVMLEIEFQFVLHTITSDMSHRGYD